MEALVTAVRQIDKRTVTESSNVRIADREGAVLSRIEDESMKAGDFYFRPQTLTHYERTSWFRRIVLRQKEKLISKTFLTVVISCPFCGLPILTPTSNTVVSRSPLTLEQAIGCPYRSAQGTHSFWIKDGEIKPAYR
jgi:hypothetical protein